jgi:hypothetical protein
MLLGWILHGGFNVQVYRQGNQHAQGSMKRQRGSRRMAGGGLTVQAGAVAASRTRG